MAAANKHASDHTPRQKNGQQMEVVESSLQLGKSPRQQRSGATNVKEDVRSRARRPAALALFYWVAFVETRWRERGGFAFFFWSGLVTQPMKKDGTGVKIHINQLGGAELRFGCLVAVRSFAESINAAGVSGASVSTRCCLEDVFGPLRRETRSSTALSGRPQYYDVQR